MKNNETGNVFITNENGKKSIVKLLDFGISNMIELSHMKTEDDILGTFGYISPEVSGILDNVIDERSDLYSVGIIFYQLITKQMPFKEKNLRALLHHQVAYTPVRPSALNGDIPEILDEIIMKLLNKDPDFRYQSAKGLIHDLKKLETGEMNFPVGSKDQKIKLSYQTILILWCSNTWGQ